MEPEELGGTAPRDEVRTFVARPGHYLHEALEHEFEEQISRDTFRNAVHEVAHWLSHAKG